MEMEEEMRIRVYERRQVRLRRAGGSLSVVIPKSWLERQGITEEADLILASDGIHLVPREREAPDLDDDPRFLAFMESLVDDTREHPEKLVDATDLVRADAAWLAELGVDTE
jgi:hypothetical protein